MATRIIQNPGPLRLAGFALVVAAVVAAISVLFTFQTSSAQDDPACEPTALGQLADRTGPGLLATGQWSAQDCESQFRPGNRARHFEFEVAVGGRVRIELTSGTADSYLYLLAADGTRIAEDDDSGASLNARIERDLVPGTYTIETTTVGAPTHESADFDLSVEFVEGCDLIPLGALTPDAPITASGSWSRDTCGSRIVVAHPAYNYLFQLPEPGRVRIDLTSPNGDPVASLATVDGVVIGANDDGGVGVNSLISQYLPAGAYIIEATTYSRGGLQPQASDFELSIRIVDELAAQLEPNPKVEFLAVPEKVVSGDPFDVHFRVGNHGGGGLYGNAASYLVLVRGPENRHWGNPVPIAESTWAAGSSYHTGEPAAGSASTMLEGLAPVQLRLEEPGRSWVLVAIYALNEDDRGLWFHATWQHVDVVQSAEFETTLARVDGRTYSVAATADAEGIVTTTVSDIADRQREIGPPERIQAIYSAGTRRLLLDEIFDRETIAELELLSAGSALGPAMVAADSLTPESESIMAAFAAEYAAAVSDSGLAASAAAGHIVDPAAVETLMLDNADRARRNYLSLASQWRQLRSRLGNGGAITFAEAISLHSQLRYAESLLDSAVRAGGIVAAARAAESGWQSDSVLAQVAEFARGAACGSSPARLAEAISSADPVGAATRLELDSELRLALPIFGTAADRALCAAAAADGANDGLFNLLGLGASDSALLPGYRFSRSPVSPVPEPHSLRILARLNADGRIEHAVEFADGQLVRPERRFLEPGAPQGRWFSSSAVELLGRSVGTIRSQLNAQGQVVLSFQGADGAHVFPKIRIMPAGASVGVWLRSSQIEVPPATPQLAAVG